MSDPRPLSLVKFDYENVHADYRDQYPFEKYDPEKVNKGVYLFLGEIVQMPGHCVLINIRTNEIHTGFHTDNFIELTEEEV
jgi:hypothetical protein